MADVTRPFDVLVVGGGKAIFATPVELAGIKGGSAMSKTKTSFFSAAVSILWVGALFFSSLAQESPKKLLVAYAGLISTHTSLWLAEDQGLFKRHGLDVASVFTGSGSVTSQVLLAGEVRVASTSVGPTAGAVGAGADPVILRLG